MRFGITTTATAWLTSGLLTATLLTTSSVAAPRTMQDPPQPQPQSQPQSQPAPQPDPAIKLQRPKSTIIRGCLTGSKLTHIEPVQLDDASANIPDVLRVSSIRVIRSQVKALNGHTVELIGTLRGIRDQERGLLVGESGAGRVYIGGAPKNLGDERAERIEPPTMHANTIKDIAPACDGAGAGAK
jgi:hypothetical protein